MGLRNKIRIYIYKTYVRFVIIYNIETRAEATITKCSLGTIEMNILRCIISNILQDRIHNENIRNICEIQNIIRWIRIKRGTWRNYVNRMDDRLAKTIKNRKSNSLRSLEWISGKRQYKNWASTSQENRHKIQDIL